MHAAPIVDFNAVLFKPGSRTGTKAKGEQDHIGGQNLLAAGYDLGATTTVFVRFSQLGGDQFDPFYARGANNFHRLTIE